MSGLFSPNFFIVLPNDCNVFRNKKLNLNISLLLLNYFLKYFGCRLHYMAYENRVQIWSQKEKKTWIGIQKHLWDPDTYAYL